MEDWPIESWTLEVSMRFPSLDHRFFLKGWCNFIIMSDIRIEKGDSAPIIWDISKFHSRWTHSKITFIYIYITMFDGNIWYYMVRSCHILHFGCWRILIFFSPELTWQTSSAKDKPEFRFGISDMDDLSIRRTPSALKPVLFLNPGDFNTMGFQPGFLLFFFFSTIFFF